MHRRELLVDLCRAAWESVAELIGEAQSYASRELPERRALWLAPTALGELVLSSDDSSDGGATACYTATGAKHHPNPS